MVARRRANDSLRRASFVFLLGAAFGLAAGMPLKARAADTRAPTVPTGLAAKAVSGSQIQLSWNASKDNVGVKGYYIYVNDAPLTTTTGTSFTHSGLTAGTTYNYRVSAFDAVPNHSAWTAAVAAAPLATADTQAPSVPTGLSAKAVSSSQVQLSWNASTDNVGVTGYYVYLNDAPLTTTTGTSYTYNGVNGSSTSFRVSAFDAVPNHSAWTAPVAAQAPVADTQPPSVPTGLTATAVSSTQNKLSWNASTDNVGVTGYYVYLNDAPLTTVTGTSFTHSGLTAGTTYNYRVSAFDAVPNHSAWTAAISAKAAVADTQAPSVPSGLTATPVSGSQIKLAWNASTDNVGVTGYYVYLNDAPLTTTTGTSFTHSGLTAGTTYNYRVSAFDAVPNHSAWTATPVSAKTTTTSSSSSSPYSGTPIPIPSTFEAENFDAGGEGVAYHDATTGNLGGQYRTSEHVDIVISGDSAGGGYAINNFTTGEWLNYTVNVATSGVYNIEIRASTTYSNSAFRVEVDGVDVTGPITVPNTGSWTAFQWVGKKNVSLTAGKHVLKVHSSQAYFNINQIRVLASTASDTSAPTVSITSPAAGAVVSGTMSVTASASDNVGVVGVQFKNNGVNLGAEDTTNAYSVSADTKTVPDGTYALTAVARDAAGNVTSSAPVSITIKNSTTAVTPGGTVLYSCMFPGAWSTCGFSEQAKVSGRATVLSWGRGGSRAVRLHTEPGDNNVAGSGTHERDDLSSGGSQSTVGAVGEGKSYWWAQSVMFPSDFYNPPISIDTWNWYAIFGWHHTGSTGQGNFSLFAYPDTATSSDRPTGLVFRICGGSTVITDALKCNLTPIGKHEKNVWYDFVYHVKWSSGTDGYIDVWLRKGDESIGRKVVTYRGPTLYTGMSAYLKLANYHTPHNIATSVIHSRVIRGTTWNAVSMMPLEGISY